ncbi:Sialidase [Xylariales sp. AK1849]|nr:Sialidase [Xylariales sp. AK1849]
MMSMFLQAVSLLVCLPLLTSGLTIQHKHLVDPISVRDLGTLAVTETAVVQAVEESGNNYARTARLSDGSILLAYSHHNNTFRRLDVLRSTNNSTKFTPFGSIAAVQLGDLDNVFLMEVPGSSPPEVLAAFRNHDLDANGDYTKFRITVCRSADGGRNWTYLSQAAQHTPAANETFPLGLWEPFMRMGSDGDIQLTYSGELAANNQETFRVVSSDGGATWTDPVDLRVHNASENLRDGMQGIVSVTDQSDGRAALVMVFETNPNTTFNVGYAVSYDDGASWGNRSVVYVPPSGRNAGSPQIVAISNNKLAVLFMTDESTDTQDWANVAQVKAVTSTGLNAGIVAWSDTPTLVSEEDSHWPGVLAMGDQILTVYDLDTVVEGKILSWK